MPRLEVLVRREGEQTATQGLELGEAIPVEQRVGHRPDLDRPHSPVEEVGQGPRPVWGKDRDVQWADARRQLPERLRAHRRQGRGEGGVVAAPPSPDGLGIRTGRELPASICCDLRGTLVEVGQQLPHVAK